MGRDVTADKTPLLQNAEQNIGNSAEILPQVGPLGPLVNTGTCLPDTNPARLLDLSGGSAAGQTTSIVMTVSRIVGSSNPHPGYPGPITGIIEFGSGGRSTRVEFDMPIGPFLGSILAALPATEPQDGVVIVTVPTSTLRAYTRYDNRLIAPVLNFTAPTSLAQIQGKGFIGPGGPVLIPTIPPTVTPAEPVLTKAMTAYFTRHYSAAYRTLYCFVATLGGAGFDLALVSSIPSPGLSPVYYCLPAFAKTVQILRRPVTTNLTVTLNNGLVDVDQFSVVAGSQSPIVKLPGGIGIITIQSVGAADTVSHLAISCEVGV